MLGLLVISSLSLSLSLYLLVFVIVNTGTTVYSTVKNFQKMYRLFGLKHHKVGKSLDVTIVTHGQRTESEDRARIL